MFSSWTVSLIQAGIVSDVKSPGFAAKRASLVPANICVPVVVSQENKV